MPLVLAGRFAVPPRRKTATVVTAAAESDAAPVFCSCHTASDTHTEGLTEQGVVMRAFNPSTGEAELCCFSEVNIEFSCLYFFRWVEYVVRGRKEISLSLT